MQIPFSVFPSYDSTSIQSGSAGITEFQEVIPDADHEHRGYDGVSFAPTLTGTRAKQETQALLCWEFTLRLSVNSGRGGDRCAGLRHG
jgi:hypothetical protein